MLFFLASYANLKIHREGGIRQIEAVLAGAQMRPISVKWGDMGNSGPFKFPIFRPRALLFDI